MFILSLEESQYEFDFEMALLDIKSERYSEAEEKLSEVARKIKSENAYLGIGISKLGKYVTGETKISEVFFCFNKALNLATKKDEIGLVTSEFILNIAKELIELAIRKAYEFKQSEAKEFLAELAFAGSIMTRYLVKDNRDLKAINTGVGIYSLLKMSSEKKNKIIAATEGKYIALKIEELKVNSLNFLSQFSDIHPAFLTAFEKLEKYAYNAIASAEQKRLDRKEEQLKSLELSDPFYTYRKEAKLHFQNKDYELALENIKLGREKVPDDHILNDIGKQCITKIVDKQTMWVAYLLIICFIPIAFIAIDNKSDNPIIDESIGFVIMGLILFSLIILTIWIIRKRLSLIKKLKDEYLYPID